MSEQRWKEGDPPEFLVPRTCSQCGQPWIHRACGPTHAIIAAGFIVGRSALRDGPLADLRSRLAAAEEQHRHVESDASGLAYKLNVALQDLAAANAEIGRLEAIIGRLPKTNDDVPIMSLDEVWILPLRPDLSIGFPELRKPDELNWKHNACWSTQAAAIAARAAEGRTE